MGNLKTVKGYAYSTDDTLKGNHPEENFEATYSYEDNVWIDGIKYQKGSEEQYVYDENGNPTEMMEFLYDKSGSITGFTYEDKTYFYVKNPQRDVTNIVDLNGVNLVNYYYCCYGESTSYVDESAYEYEYDRDSIGILQEVNPITYRGYYRDEETSFYYLQSRYYIPTWGRFLNADIPVYAQSQKNDFAGINLFAYCRNNPVNFSDPTGYKYVSEAGMVVAIAITEMFVCLDLQEIAKLLDIDFDFKDIEDYFKKKKDLYKKYSNKNKKTLSKEDKKKIEKITKGLDIAGIIEDLVPNKASKALSIYNYIKIIYEDSTEKYGSKKGAAIMLSFDLFVNLLIDASSIIIEKSSHPALAIAVNEAFKSWVDKLGTREKAEFIAYNWYYLLLLFGGKK